MKKKPIIILISVCVGIWLLSLIGLTFFFGTPKDPGVFGDMFGAVNVLFSGLALAFVIYAVFLQLEELEIQREELKNSRRELAAQNEIISAQLKSMKESFDFEKRKEERASEPLFMFAGGSSSPPKSKNVKVINKGATVSAVTITYMPKIRPISDIKVWEKDSIQTFSFNGPDSYQQDITVAIRDTLTDLGQLKVKNLEYLRRQRNYLKTNAEQGELVNARSRARTSEKHLQLAPHRLA